MLAHVLTLALCAGDASRVVESPCVVTYFFYWYCRDSGEHFTNHDGTDALTTHPASDEGYSYRRQAWWRQEFQEILSAGINAVLPVYWGVPGEENWSKAGLRVMVPAWDALMRGGDGAPRVGMFYDTSTLLWNPGGKRIDISTDEGTAFFVRTITEFFELVPRRMWMLRKGRPVVFLYSGSFHTGENPRLFEELRARFREQFGTDVYLVKEVSWPQEADAVYAWGGALGLQLHDVASLGPGYDHTAVPGRQPLIVPRRDGDFYRANWERLLALAPARRPDMVAVETWNEFHEGTDVAPSVEYGRVYQEMTARYSDLFRRRMRLPLRGPWQGHDEVSWKDGLARGVTIPSAGDGIIDVVNVAGRTGARTAPSPHGPARYLYIALDDSFIFDADGKALTFTVTLRVEKPGGVVVEYDGANPAASVRMGAFTPAPVLGPFEPGAWHEVAFTLKDGRFVNRTNGADLRLSSGGNDLLVAEVRVSRAGGGE